MSVSLCIVLVIASWALASFIWYNQGLREGRGEGRKTASKEAELESDELDPDDLRVLIARDTLDTLIENGDGFSSSVEERARMAVEYADELIKHLKENQP